MQPATVRFGDRVADYLHSRPGYPAELLDVLVRHCGFSHSTVVADVGAGTGLLTRLFLDATPFLRGYEDLLIRLCPEYLRVVHRNVDERALSALFAPCPFDQVVLDNRQVFDWDGLVSRHLSSSFVPSDGPERDLNLAALRSLFDATAIGGRVEFEYDTRIHLGRLH